MTIRYHPELIQGSEEWLAARCGMLTASEFSLLLTPKKLQAASNAKERMHCWELAAQRISQYVEPQYIGDDMLRGLDDEITARELYAEHWAPVTQCGFVTNDRWGFTLGCSPDGLVGDDGMIECKSRRQKFQVQTVCEHYERGTIPDDFLLQVQGELLVTEREWCDLITFSGGLPMVPMRVHADREVQNAIVLAAAEFETRIKEVIETWEAALEKLEYVPTERRVEQEMYA